MGNHTERKKPIEILAIFQEAFDLYKANFSLFFSLSLTGYAIFILDQALEIYGLRNWGLGFINFLIGYLILFWATAALISSVHRGFREDPVEFKASFWITRGKVLPLIGISILQWLIFAVGFLLLVIPGFYWAVIFSLAGLAFILDDAPWAEAFKGSKKLIQGHFWPILGLYLLVMIINSLPSWLIYSSTLTLQAKSILLYLVSALLMPWGIAISVSVYNRLKASRTQMPEMWEHKSPHRSWGLGCLGMVALFITVIALSVFWIKNTYEFMGTEKGGQVFEWVAGKISSSNLELTDEISFERPKGYLIRPMHQGLTGYHGLGFVERKIFAFTLFVLPFDKLGISDRSALELGSGQIWERYVDYLDSQTTQTENRFANMKKEILTVIDIDGQPWAKCILQGNPQAKLSPVWVFYYTLEESGVVFLTAGYTHKKNQTEPSPEEQLLLKILNGKTNKSVPQKTNTGII